MEGRRGERKGEKERWGERKDEMKGRSVREEGLVGRKEGQRKGLMRANRRAEEKSNYREASFRWMSVVNSSTYFEHLCGEGDNPLINQWE